MARVCIADLEADGLLDVATRVHCGVFKDVKTNEIFKFTEHTVGAMLEFMASCDACIMHNGIGYDWPLLRKLYAFDYKGKKVDTLLMSRLQRPHRAIPKGAGLPTLLRHGAYASVGTSQSTKTGACTHPR